MSSTRFRLIALAAAAAMTIVIACTGGSDGTPPARPDGDLSTGGAISAVGPGLSVGDARASTLDGPLLVNGFVVVADGRVRLCDTLAESFPPQCGGDSLTLSGFPLEGFELQRSGDVAWTDHSVQVLGYVEQGVMSAATNSIASGAGPITR